MQHGKAGRTPPAAQHPAAGARPERSRPHGEAAPPCLCRILRKDPVDGTRSHGSGILLSAHWLLTARHVIQPRGRAFGRWDPPLEGLTAQANGAASRIDAAQPGHLIVDPHDGDLALVRLEQPLPGPYATLLTGIPQPPRDKELRLPLIAWGYPAKAAIDGPAVSSRWIGAGHLPTWSDGELRDIQFAGGLEHGVSGGALCAEIDQAEGSSGLGVVGLLYQGGEGAATSLAHCMPRILPLLAQAPGLDADVRHYEMPATLRGGPTEVVQTSDAEPTDAEWAKLARHLLARVEQIGAGVRDGSALVDLEVEIDPVAGRRLPGLTLFRRPLWQRPLPRFLFPRRKPWAEEVIAKTLEKTNGLPLLLVGEPGAGKSIALGRLARRQLAGLIRRKRLKGRIPLYINLRDLRLPEGEAVTGEHIREYVIRQGAAVAGKDNGSATRADFEHCLRWGLREGRWLILLDSFDEIPALLAADDVEQAATAFGGAIRDFALDCGRGDCPIVVASRPYRSPERLNWRKLVLKPLDDRRIREVIDARFKPKRRADRVLTELAERQPVLGEYLRNPLFLALICDYLAKHKQAPESLGGVFDSYVDERLRLDALRLTERGIEPEELRLGAQEIAFRMTAEPDLGLSPDKALLLERLRDGSWPLPTPPERIIDALEECQLAITEQQPNMELFRFARHRRLQEYFATKAILADPGRIAIDQLLWTDAWRETTVTLLETASATALRPLHAEIAAVTQAWANELDLPHEIDGEPITTVSRQRYRAWLKEQGREPTGEPFPWPERATHLLGILNDAKTRGGLGDPATEHASDRLLCAAFLGGTRQDQLTSIELVRAGSRTGTLALIHNAFGSGSTLLADAALEQSVRLDEIPEPLLPRIRESLAAQWALGALDKKTSELTRRRLRYIDPSGGLNRSYRLLKSHASIDYTLIALAVICIAILNATGLGSEGETNAFRLFVQGALGGTILYALPMLFVSAAAGRVNPEPRAHYCFSRKPVDCVWATRIFPRLVWGGLLFSLVTLAIIAGSGVTTWDETLEIELVSIPPTEYFALLGPSLIVLAFWASWGHFGPAAAMYGVLTKKWQWGLVFTFPLLRPRPWITGLSKALFSQFVFWRDFGIYVGALFAVIGLESFVHDLRRSSAIIDRVFSPLREPALTANVLGQTYWPLVVFSLIYLFFFVAPTLNELRLRTLLLFVYAAGKRKRSSLRIMKLVAAASRSPLLLGNQSRAFFLRQVRIKSEISPSAQLKHHLKGIVFAITRDTDRRATSFLRKPVPESRWQDTVQAWYERHARRGNGVAYLDGPVVDELVILQMQVAKDLAERELDRERWKAAHSSDLASPGSDPRTFRGTMAPISRSKQADRDLYDTVIEVLQRPLVEWYKEPRALLSNAFFAQQCDPRAQMQQDGTPLALAQQWVDTLLHFKCARPSDHPLATLLETAYRDQREPQVDFEGGWQGLLARLRELNTAGAG
jgi:hypothetical protein